MLEPRNKLIDLKFNLDLMEEEEEKLHYILLLQLLGMIKYNQL